MNIYSKKQRWKLLLAIAALLIILTSMWYTNTLVQKIAEEERQKVELWAEAIQKKAKLVSYTGDLFKKIAKEERKRIEIWAEATKRLAYTESDEDRTFFLDIISSNTTIPVILVNEDGEIATSRNLDPEKENDSLYLRGKLESMKKNNEPIEVVFYGNRKSFLYYENSEIFVQLQEVFNDLMESFISEVINSASSPVIFTDSTQQNVIAYGNIDSVDVDDEEERKNMISTMGEQNKPIEIHLDEGRTNYIFYRDSYLITQLKYYPLFQFGVIGLFLLVAYYLFSTARKAEQNQVWVGMAKETAHQLGTPLSSLMAWQEYLRSKNVDEKSLKEMGKDVERLETITERFSKIGSQPKLESENLSQTVNKSVNYLRSRLSAKVNITVETENEHDVYAKFNPSLFSWVLENLIKNAVDAMEGKGNIQVKMSDQTQYLYLDITDDGKGIPKNKHKTVFEPGFTSKKRGWGLGLSLAKRIIENYHSGKIFVKSSAEGKGTTFRIVLNK